MYSLERYWLGSIPEFELRWCKLRCISCRACSWLFFQSCFSLKGFWLWILWVNFRSLLLSISGVGRDEFRFFFSFPVRLSLFYSSRLSIILLTWVSLFSRFTFLSSIRISFLAWLFVASLLVAWESCSRITFRSWSLYLAVAWELCSYFNLVVMVLWLGIRTCSRIILSLWLLYFRSIGYVILHDMFSLSLHFCGIRFLSRLAFF
jgi:hypothetical protein